MSYLAGLIVSLIANVIWVLTAIVWRRRLWKDRAYRRFWTNSHREVEINFSETFNDFKDKYECPTTCVGDAVSVGLVKSMLQQSLGRKQSLGRTGYAGSDIDLTDVSKDHVCIGGPLRNAATRKVLDALECHKWVLPYEFYQADKDADDSDWFIRGPETSLLGLTLEEQAQKQKKKVIADFGFVARLPYPDVLSGDGERARVFWFAGLSAFGTLCATQYATDVNRIREIEKEIKNTIREKHYSKADYKFFMALIKWESYKNTETRIGEGLYDVAAVLPVRKKEERHSIEYSREAHDGQPGAST